MADHDVFITTKALEPHKSTNKVVYLCTVENLDDPSESDYYLSQKLEKNPNLLVIRGQHITKAQRQKLVKETPDLAQMEIEIEIPWHKVKRIENLTFKKAQKGKNNE